MAAATYGWPMVLHDSESVPLPQAIDDEYLQETGEGEQPENIPSRVSFYVEYIKLCETICGDVLAVLYTTGPEDNKDDKPKSSQYMTELPNLCARMDEFFKALPAHLKDENYSASDNVAMNKCFCSQGLFLRTR